MRQLITVAAIIDCSSLDGGSRKANIATIIQTAYEMGERETVSNKIESLVAERKPTPSQEYPPSDASAVGGSMRGATRPPRTRLPLPLGVFASPRVANPRKGRLPQMP